MASVPFTIPRFFHKPTPQRFLASDRVRFGAGSAIWCERVQKNHQKLGSVVCRPGYTLAFQDLDADDFRHPLDKQVSVDFAFLRSDGTKRRRFENESFILVSAFSSVLLYVFLGALLMICGLIFFNVQNTLLLRAIPGLNELGKSLIGIE